MDCPDSVRRVHLVLGVLQIVGAEAVKRAGADGKPRSTDWLKSNADSGATYMRQLREAAKDCREAINRTLGTGWTERLVADCDLCVQIAERAADPPTIDGQPIGEFLHNMTDLPAEWAPINGRLTERRSTLLQIVAGGIPLDADNCWSEPKSPKIWARAYEITPATFLRWRKQEKIRSKELSERWVCVHLDDLPQKKT